MRKLIPQPLGQHNFPCFLAMERVHRISVTHNKIGDPEKYIMSTTENPVVLEVDSRCKSKHLFILTVALLLKEYHRRER